MDDYLKLFEEMLEEADINNCSACTLREMYLEAFSDRE